MSVIGSSGAPLVQANQPTIIYNAEKTVAVAGTAEALIIASTELYSGVEIQALSGNTNNIFIGDVSVDSTNGFILAAGEKKFIEINDLSKVYIDVTTNAEGVRYLAT